MAELKKENIWQWLLRSLKPWLPSLLLLTFGYIASASLSVWFAVGSRDVINSAIARDQDPFIRAAVKQGLIILAIIVDNFLINHLKEKLTAVMDRDWKHNMLRGLLRGEYADISSYHTGELLNRINGDVRILISSLLSVLPSIASMSTRVVACVGVLLAMAPKLTVILLLGGVVVLIVTGIVRRRLKSLNKRASEAQGKVSGFIQETLEKLLMVQAMDISEVIEERSDVLLEERYRIHKKRKTISVISSTCMSILSYGISFGTLIWCAFGILQGNLTMGDMTAITQLVTQLRGPMLNASGITPQVASMTAAAERLMELEQICDTVAVERKEAAPLYAAMTGIRGENLTFAYDRDAVFDHADFVLPKGSFGVIVGHSGIGKSTLLKLLLGIFPPKEGGLYIDTADGPVKVDRTTRPLFAYVPQGNLLLSGTLRDNLLVTRKNATEEEINRALYVSAMDDYLPTLPQGLDTVVGENALGLSEGQAQRLSIARAVLSDAPIFLLDEATSALDDATEKAVLSRLQALPGKTCIAVTHREAAMQIADWSLKMQEGKCVITMLK